jgi:hypothetical protein
MTNNPYQVTFLTDEKPVDVIRFVRRRPVPCKLTGSMIRRVTWQTFRGKVGQFIVLGFLQLGLLLVALLASYLCALPIAYIANLTSSSEDTPFGIILGIQFLFLVMLLLFNLIGYTIVANGTLRLLQGKKITPETPESKFHLSATWGNCFCYGLICLLMLLPVWVLSIASLIGLEQTSDLALSNLWLAVFCVGLVLFVLLGMFVIGCYAIGLHYIIDRNVGCLTALRRSAKYTRGNGFTIAVSFLLHGIILYVVAFVTVALGAVVLSAFLGYNDALSLGFVAMVFGFVLAIVFAYLHCWLAATYHLTTGQYNHPADPETDEW